MMTGKEVSIMLNMLLLTSNVPSVETADKSEIAVHQEHHGKHQVSWDRKETLISPRCSYPQSSRKAFSRHRAIDLLLRKVNEIWGHTNRRHVSHSSSFRMAFNVYQSCKCMCTCVCFIYWKKARGRADCCCFWTWTPNDHNQEFSKPMAPTSTTGNCESI